MSSNSDDGQGAIGCLIILAIGMFGSVIIQVIEALVMLATVGGVGFLIYKIVLFDQRTGNITRFFENLTDGVNDSMERRKSRKVHYIGEQKTQYLPAGKEDELLGKIGKLVDVMEGMNAKLDKQDQKFKLLEDRLDEKVQLAIEKHFKGQKQKALDDLFTNQNQQL